LFIYYSETNDETKRIDLCRDAKKIEKILQRAVDHALEMHRRLGNPIAVWKDGKVVIVPPEEIVLSSELSRAEE
jgi:ABC-type proline/glycine betaine transport system ATPase subunit